MRYDPAAPICVQLAEVRTEFTLVVTNPYLLAVTPVVEALADALAQNPSAPAAVPVSNEASNPAQRSAPAAPYLTLRGLEAEVAERFSRKAEARVTTWAGGDFSIALVRTESLRTGSGLAAAALDGRAVAIVQQAYVHVWAPLRTQNRADMLLLVPDTARSILEFGCADGQLGEMVKRRQACHYSGIELDPTAAAAASSRLDTVHEGDARLLVCSIAGPFDCIIGGDVLEHLDDPWTFLRDVKRVAAPGAALILSLPNAGHGAILSNLLHGRFDYTYFGLACAGHLRFFTRRTIEDLLVITGWEAESVTPIPDIRSREALELESILAGRGEAIPEHYFSPGFYVVARSL